MHDSFTSIVRPLVKIYEKINLTLQSGVTPRLMSNLRLENLRLTIRILGKCKIHTEFWEILMWFQTHERHVDAKTNVWDPGSFQRFDGDEARQDEGQDEGPEHDAHCEGVECFLVENVSERRDLSIECVHHVEVRHLHHGDLKL